MHAIKEPKDKADSVVFMLFLAKEVQKTTVCFEWGPKIACLPMSHENIIPCIITGISMAALLTDSSQLFFFLPLFFLYRSGFLAAIHLLICIAEADLWDISLQQGDGAVWKQPTDCNSSCSHLAVFSDRYTRPLKKLAKTVIRISVVDLGNPLKFMTVLL